MKSTIPSSPPGHTSPRIDWVDIAKGICIIFVVLMHSTLGVEKAAGAEGWMHQVVTFARPFRMPDFFLISGLFLGIVIARPWRRYIDRKVVHFAYFYLLWVTIQYAFKAPGIALESGMGAALGAYLMAFVQPFGTLWFIYLLPIMFIVTRVLRPLPSWMVFAWAALLETLAVHTGSVIVDEFCARYVYFFAGYWLAGNIFQIADWVRTNKALAFSLLCFWGVVNAMLVFNPPGGALAAWVPPMIHNTGQTGGYSELPLVSLALGLAGAGAIIAVSALLADMRGSNWLRWLGAHSIVVYLAFFLPMAVTRTVLLKTGLVPDVGTIALLTTIAGVVGPAIAYGIVQWTGYGRFLFERPQWAKIDSDVPRSAVAHG